MTAAIVDVIIAVLITIGAGFMAIAAIGVVRMPDIYSRLHCSTKAATLGVGCLLLGVAVASGDPAVWARCLAGLVFFVITAPITGHALARAAWHSGERPTAITVIEEAQPDVHGATPVSPG